MNRMFMTTVLILGISTGAYAATPGERTNPISVASGIAHPSIDAPLMENVAGVVYNSKPKFTLNYAMLKDSPDKPVANGQVFFGNGTIAAGVGVQYDAGDSGGATSISYQSGFYVSPLRAAFGIGGKTTFLTGDNQLNTGAIFNPYGDIRMGFNLYEIDDGVEEFGIGVAADFTQNVGFMTDFIAPNSFNHLGLKPGFLFKYKKFFASISYGFMLKDRLGELEYMRKRLSFGAGYRIGKNMILKAYFNKISDIYAAFAVMF